MKNVYYFVTDRPGKERIPLEAISDSKAYLLRQKINNGERLTLADKAWITDNVNKSAYSKKGIPIAGWMFDFSDVLKLYVFKQYNTWDEKYACTKQTLRLTTYGKIDRILEILK